MTWGVIKACESGCSPPYPSPMGPNTLTNQGLDGAHFGEFGKSFGELFKKFWGDFR
jgi:hypothetical protein